MSVLSDLWGLPAGTAVPRELVEAKLEGGEAFTVDSISRAPRPFQKHNEVSVEGRWARETLDLPAGTYIIPARQSLALVAMIMLEPQSDDGLTTWNGFDAQLAVGKPHPVRRALAPVSGAR